jgi:hypothetical protein
LSPVPCLKELKHTKLQGQDRFVSSCKRIGETPAKLGLTGKAIINLSVLRFRIACISYCKKVYFVFLPEILDFSNVSGTCTAFNI